MGVAPGVAFCYCSLFASRFSVLCIQRCFSVYAVAFLSAQNSLKRWFRGKNLNRSAIFWNSKTAPVAPVAMPHSDSRMRMKSPFILILMLDLDSVYHLVTCPNALNSCHVTWTPAFLSLLFSKHLCFQDILLDTTRSPIFTWFGFMKKGFKEILIYSDELM